MGISLVSKFQSVDQRCRLFARVTTLRCNKCSNKINQLVAAESALRMVTACLGLGMKRDAIAAVTDQQSPLCRKCIAAWDPPKKRKRG